MYSFVTVNGFIYLGSEVASSSNITTEVTPHITCGNRGFYSLNKIFPSGIHNRKLKYKLFYALARACPLCIWIRESAPYLQRKKNEVYRRRNYELKYHQGEVVTMARKRNNRRSCAETSFGRTTCSTLSQKICKLLECRGRWGEICLEENETIRPLPSWSVIKIEEEKNTFF